MRLRHESEIPKFSPFPHGGIPLTSSPLGKNSSSSEAKGEEPLPRKYRETSLLLLMSLLTSLLLLVSFWKTGGKRAVDAILSVHEPLLPRNSVSFYISFSLIFTF